MSLPAILLDNSVVQRLHDPEVAAAVDRLRGDLPIATCLPVLLEQGFCARSAVDHDRLMTAAFDDAVVLHPSPEVMTIAVGLQAALFRAGLGRAVGVSDLQIAATAIHHSTVERPVVLVHYDRDFDHVVAVEPRLRSRWIVPPGSVA